MDSHSHYTKVGSKHLCDPRPDHPHALARNISVPSLHPYNERRALLRDPTPWHFNENFSTSNDSYGTSASIRVSQVKEVLLDGERPVSVSLKDEFHWFGFGSDRLPLPSATICPKAHLGLWQACGPKSQRVSFCYPSHWVTVPRIRFALGTART
ncbi:unnamed protein product [Effrenium voratum]|uniref:Uncharacterized protein n=1 Tax=Effrenium voratum TaxID=2562239 RepID=A0AA36NET9_9DINO|nr:unnamed protein product [Effrenium voratum]CAJ1419362.1 unnamed protein product [Effrenium voratum]CAJ1443249.1 unnamed protein product [Effrenium voratum]